MEKRKKIAKKIEMFDESFSFKLKKKLCAF